MRSVEGFPLSPQQRQLWHLLQSSHGRSYFAHCVVRLPVDLSIPRLEEALGRVVARHEILRTGFRRLPGMPVPLQVIERNGAISLAHEDLRGTLPGERRARIERLLDAMAEHTVDFDRVPLLRGTVARIALEESWLLLGIPALCADEATLTRLVEELGCWYDILGRGGEVEGEPMQYADFAAWQNDLLGSDDSAERKLLHEGSLWSNRGLTLSGGRRTPQSAAEFAPRALFFAIGSDRASRVAAEASRLNSSETAVLLAAWFALLWRLTGQTDIVVGTLYDGRKFEELEGVLGPVARHLPVRALLQGETRFRDLVGRLDDSLRSLHEWQEYFSLEDLAGTAGDVAGPLFFPVCFSLEEQPATRGGGCGFALLEKRACCDRFEIRLACARRGDGLTARLELDSGMYAAEDLLLLPGHFLALLASALDAPGTPLADLSLLGEAERHHCLVEWNDTRHEPLLERSIPALIAVQAARVPDRIAVVFEGEELTYGELESCSNRLANHLRNQGIGREARVAVCLERSLNLVVALLAVLKAGGAYVPLDPSYPAERLALMLEDSGARLLVTADPLSTPPGAGGLPVVRLNRDRGEIDRVSASPPPAWPAAAADLAYVIYTSGSTGRPKGVMISHGAICNRLLWMQEAFPLGAADRVLQKTPFSFDASVWELFCPLLAGACLVVARPGGHQDGEYLIQTVASQGITVLQLVPSALRMLLELPGLEAAVGLERLFCGGEALSSDLVEAFRGRSGAQLVNLYGPTEVAIDATFRPCRTPSAGASAPIGRPLANARVYLLDAELRPVAPGLRGELYVGGAGLARGYHGRPDLTAEKFLPDLFGEPGARLYRTGDLGRHLPDGEIEFLGRADQQVKIRGFRIEPGEIETVLARHPMVRAAAVAASGDGRLIGYVVPGEERPERAELRGFLLCSLPEHLVPAVFVFLEALPLTPSGKLDRAALPAPGEAAGEPPAVPARTLVEELVAGIWSEVLGRESIGAHDNVFELGAHSLLATQVVSRLRESFRVDLPLRSLFDEPTVAGLARRIEEAMRPGPASALPPIERVPRTGPLPLSFAQQRLWIMDQLDPGSSAYSTPEAFRLSGPLDVRALARTLGELVRRQEILRTTFPIVVGQPAQVIGDPWPVPLPLIDLSGLGPERREAEILRLAAPERQAPFDLARGPLLRVELMRLAEEEHVVLVTLHHIVSDAWSTWIIVREVAAVYTALRTGRRPDLPPLPIQYADFAAWQRRWLQGEVLESELAHWKQRLAGAPLVLDLPTDRPRPAVQSFRGLLQTRLLPLPLTEELKALSRRHGSSLFMVLLAAFQVLLHHQTGREDLLVGTSIANRERIEVEGLIGFFVNMLALRTSLAGDPPFTELLRRVREVTLEAYTHQSLPFDKLIEELRLPRDPGRNPVFQVVFTFENAPGKVLELEGLWLEPLELGLNTSLFDLALLMEETGHGLAAGMRYMTDLFRPATIDTMLEHLELLLTRITADPEVRLSQLGEAMAKARQQREAEQHRRLEDAVVSRLRVRTRTTIASER
jgi:amino acid adenylation domain-containing protein